MAYAVLLGVGAYAAGLLDLTRSPRSALSACIGATATGAVGISAAQLVTGSQLLPRFVVLASAVLLVPWFLACSVVANGGRKQERYHDACCWWRGTRRRRRRAGPQPWSTTPT